MTTILFSFKLTMASAFLVLTALASNTWAIPTGSHYMVNPSSCQPADSSSANRLRLISGVWAFRSNQTGYAELSCPINFSGAAGEWSLIQLWYRDGFTSVGSENGYIAGDLMRRQRHTSGATQLAWTASTYGNGAEYGFDSNQVLPSGPHNFELYYVRIRLYRQNSSREVAFTGFEVRF